jgi:transposase
LGAKISLKFIQKHFNDVKGTMVTRANYSVRHALYCQSFSTEWDYSEVKPRSGETVKEKRRMYLHLYYNDQRATDEKLRFNKTLDQLEEELLSNNKRVSKHEKLYQRYFTIHETPVKGIQLSVNEDAIKSKEERFGYFALISNGIKDPLEAIDIYRSKDLIEKAYNDLKNRLSMRRTSVSSEESLDGKLFVQFIALIFISYIKQQMDKKGLFKKYTLQEVLDELDIIERFTQPNKKSIVGEVTKKQKELYQLLGVEAIS